MMKSVYLLAFGCFMALRVAAQSSTVSDRDVEQIKIRFNANEYDSIYNMFSDRIRGLVTADKMRSSLSGLFAQMGSIQKLEDQTPSPANSASAGGKSDEKTAVHTYKTTFERGILSMMVSYNAEHKMEVFRFAPYTDPGAPKQLNNFVVNAPSCNINGTLTVPEGSGKVPVVLLIAGSGPTDRDGNSHLGVNADPYKMIADSLKQHGIACLRYDKRGVGDSKDAQAEANVKFDDYVDDAVLILKKLKADPRFSKVVVAGHSEGSLIGMIASEKEQVAAFVSLAGAGERADKVLKSQFSQGDPEVVARAGKMLDSLVGGHTVTNTEPSLEALLRKDVQPYLISWFRHDPQIEIAKLKIPVSIVQGTMDVQVSYSEAEFLKKAKPNARIVTVKGMNHVLKQVGESATREENIAAYSNKKLPVCEEVIRELVRMAK